MVGHWSNWKPFPDALHGGHLDAPIGPGIYEVCDANTREPLLFGYSPNVAKALIKAAPSHARRWRIMPRIGRRRPAGAELEYRTCTAGSVSEAKAAHNQRLERRYYVWRRHAPYAFE
jgi:hypothetical protein